ncbi:MAG: TRAP transporter small permease, partial [Clostridia bacterium]
VLFRFVFSSPLAWSEEIAKYLFIWMTFIAGYVGARKGRHIGVVALQNALPPLGGKLLRCLSNLISAVFFGTVIYYTIYFWSKLAMQTSPALGIPISIVYLGMLIGSGFMSVWYLILAVKSFESAPNPPAEVEVDNA